MAEKKTKKENKENTREEILGYVAQVEELTAEIYEIDERIDELQDTIDTIELLASLGKGKSVDIEIGSGIRVPLKTDEIKRVIVDLGPGVCAEMSLEEALDVLTQEVQDLMVYRDILATELDITYEEIDKLVKKLEKK